MRFSLYNRKYLNQYKGGILNLYAEIILNSEAIEIDRPFTYKVPLDMEEKVKVGQIVKVPFGVRSKPVEGFILDLKAEEEMKVSFKMKSILSVENEEPVITEDDIKLREEPDDHEGDRGRLSRLPHAAQVPVRRADDRRESGDRRCERPPAEARGALLRRHAHL